MKGNGAMGKNRRRVLGLLLLFCITGMFTACGKEPEPAVETGENPAEADIGTIVSPAAEDDRYNASLTQEDDMGSVSEETLSEAEGSETGETSEAESQTVEIGSSDVPETAPTELDAMQKLFGADCISEQTFEVQLSEYEQKVYFVPLAPSSENPEFRVQLIQDGQVIEELPAYVPDRLEGEEFCSLDAVSFYDVNYDGNTDILMLETYGDTRFAAVYYGRYDHFFIEEELSEHLSEQVNPLTLSEISHYLAGGKKNGEFAGYQEAYEAVSRVYDLEGVGERMTYDLIYFDEDDIPELVAGVNGYWMSMYTYDEGRVYCLMDVWPYGAWGNMGYEYVPGKNSLRNYDNDFAGAIVYTTYMTVSEQHSMETVVTIETFNFDDLNGNGLFDDEERETIGGASYIDGVEITDEECASYDVGEYEYIEGRMSLEELWKKLGR